MKDGEKWKKSSLSILNKNHQKFSKKLRKKSRKKSDNNHADLRFGLDQFRRLVFLLYVFSIPTYHSELKSWKKCNFNRNRTDLPLKHAESKFFFSKIIKIIICTILSCLAHMWLELWKSINKHQRPHLRIRLSL